jgi:hypothetical protein
MAVLRQQAVKKAKKMGICTQCLKLKSIKDRFQCQRCINTNRRKYKKRKAVDKDLCRSINPLRQIIIKYARDNAICTKCFGRTTKGSEYFQCAICRTKKNACRVKSSKPVGRPKGIKLTNQQRRDKKAGYQKKYKLNALTNKVRKLDKIRRAVEKGVEL